VKETAREQLQGWRARTAIVLGSGLNSLAEEVAFAQRISYREFPELPTAKILGHKGQFALASINNEPVVYAQGRAHLYEGHSAYAVTANVRLLAECGIKRIILTNAAGTTNPDFLPGRWMMIRDHLNLTGTTPLIGAGQFLDMSNLYSPEARASFARVAKEAKVTLYEGVYAGLIGPQYETPAEVRMLRILGADALGMSTVLERLRSFRESLLNQLMTLPPCGG
jgi:purine-nucleoside phosphorylase